jgi:hypothetical protein
MSAGAVFQLLTNDGRLDRMLLATDLLNFRIKQIMSARRAARMKDIIPTLADIEKTHILFINAHYKPFAAIGYEYNRVRPTGAAGWSSDIVFTIPQFGDFFNDMVVRTRIGAGYSSAQTTPAKGTAAFPADAATSAAAGPYYAIADPFGQPLTISAAVSFSNFVRYVEYPGNRLFSRVSFDVNGNPLDDYDSNVAVMRNKFYTSANKRIVYDRLCGQEVPVDGYSGLSMALVTDQDSANTPQAVITRDSTGSPQSNQSVSLFQGATIGAITGGQPTVLGQVATFPLTAASTQYDVSRKLLRIVNGPQTPKPVQSALEIWNKLLFWFNDDVRLSIPSVSLPYGQRNIHIHYCTMNDIIRESPGIYLERVDDNIATPGVTTTRRITYTPIYQPGTLVGFALGDVELYINNIFVNPEIHDIFIQRIGFSLIRVYRTHNASITAPGDSDVLLSQLKWPVEYMMIGMRPKWNNNTNNVNLWRDWHRMTKMLDVTNPQYSCAQAPIATTSAVTAVTGSLISRPGNEQYWIPVPTINKMGLVVHGVVMYDKDFQDKFYADYMPYNYGGDAIVSSTDPGALLMNFSLFPRSYQPSGHLNFSRARESYLSWNSTYISSASGCDLIVIASAINFLLISDGSAMLRYTT